MAKLNEVHKVTVSTSIFGFTVGEYYDGTKVVGGWTLTNDEGTQIVLPESVITVQIKPMAETLAGAAPKPVGQVMSNQEQEALDHALATGTPLPAASQKQPEVEGILSQIMQRDTQVGSTAIPTFTPDNLVAIGEQEELLKVRDLLRPPSTPLLREGQFWLTDLTHGQLPDSGVDYIITAYRWDYFPEALRKDVHEFDIYHEWDPNVLEDIHLAHTENVKGLLVGFPGSGKSTSYQNYSAIIRQPFMKLNGKSGIDASSFLGFLWAKAGGTEFAEGLLPVAMRLGYMLCIDEVFKIPAEIQMNFQTLYEEDGFLLLDEKPGTLGDKLVKPHPDFRLMATDNAKGTGDNFEKFGSTQVQDTSTLDRFGLTTDVPYLPQAKEVNALKRLFDGVDEDVISRFVRTANMVREAYSKSDVSLTLSMRGLKIMCRLYQRGVSEKICFNKAYRAKLGEENEIDVANGFADTVGLDNISPLKSPAQVPKTEEPTPKGGTAVSSPMPWDQPPTLASF
jgi:MoxR-like ATPase